MAQFEEACQRASIGLFVLPPRSPKQRRPGGEGPQDPQRTVLECYHGDLELVAVRPALLAWEKVYNTVRPHQALGWRTPAEYISQCHPEAASLAPLSHMY